MTFDFTTCINRFYTYRSATLLASVWIALDEKEKESLRRYLNKCGYTMDNHICWKMMDGSCFAYDDGQLGFGTEIQEGRY